ncbi:MAG: hypothetical protein FWD58_01170, partial [Firmicutes bacterium]|nr:hypothetical protein [Bacillota bacterium]
QTGIVAKCLWGTIHKYLWDEIKEVYIERFAVSHSWGFKSRWIVFNDGREGTKERNGIVTEDSFIRLKYSKRALKAVKQFWLHEIGEKEIAEEK